VLLLVLTVRVELPDVKEDGLKLALAPAGSPLTPKLTEPVNPPLGVMPAV
jgi:hypothetical protein